MTFAARLRHWLLLLPLLGLLGITYWLNLQVKPESAKPDGKTRHDPDAIMENFSAMKLNEQGMPHFIMTARKMRHYPDDDSTTLDVPRLTALSADQPPIHMIAKRGAVSSKGNEIFLHDDVEVLREANARQDEFRLQTEYLHILPDRELANTDRAVAIVDAHSTVRAIGLIMDNKARTLKLLSQVRSDHAPPRK